MKRLASGLVLLVVLSLAVWAQEPVDPDPGLGEPESDALTMPLDGPVILVEIRSALVPVVADYLERALDVAADRQASLVLLELDTPGGLVTTVRNMTTHILDSQVPVVVYVTPSDEIINGRFGSLAVVADLIKFSVPTPHQSSYVILLFSSAPFHKKAA